MRGRPAPCDGSGGVGAGRRGVDWSESAGPLVPFHSALRGGYCVKRKGGAEGIGDGYHIDRMGLTPIQADANDTAQGVGVLPGARRRRLTGVADGRHFGHRGPRDVASATLGE